MADAKKLLRALLAKAYKKQETEIDLLLADDTDDQAAETTITTWDTGRVAELTKPKPGQTFQDGYAKAKKEERHAFENEIRTKYGISADDKQGLELIDLLLTSKQGGAAGDLTDDKVKAHPLYQSLEQAKKKELKELTDAHNAKILEIEAGQKKRETFGNVSKTVLDKLRALNPALPEDANVAATWENTFVKSFEEYEWQEQNGRFIPMKDGKIIQDVHGNTKDLDDLLKEQAPKYFTFKANNGGNNAGNGKPGEGGSGAKPGAYPAGVVKPKTIEELSAVLENQTIKAEDREVVLKTWEAEQAGGTK